MQPLPVFHAEVSEDGRHLFWVDDERQQRVGYLKKLAGKAVDVVVRPHRNQRSLDQNRWWFGIAVPLIAHELGYEKHEHEDVHYALVAKCFGKKYDERIGEDVPKVRSSHLTTVQFSELMEWAVRFAAKDLGIVVPLPGESEAA